MLDFKPKACGSLLMLATSTESLIREPIMIAQEVVVVLIEERAKPRGQILVGLRIRHYQRRSQQKQPQDFLSDLLS